MKRVRFFYKFSMSDDEVGFVLMPTVRSTDTVKWGERKQN